MSTQSPPSLLSVEDLSSRFAVRKFEIRRAISRGRIAAGRTQPGKPWAITDNAVQQFVDAGMKDLAAPHLIGDDELFHLDDDDFRKAERFMQEVEQAAVRDGAILKDEQLKERAIVELSRKSPVDSLEIELKATPQLITTLRDPVPLTRLPGAKQSRYANWSQCYLAVQLWRAVPAIIQSRTSNKAASVSGSLYSGPTEYGEITKAVAKVVSDHALFIPRRVMVLQPGTTASSGRWVNFCIQYKLPHSTIMATSFNENLARLIEIAF